MARVFISYGRSDGAPDAGRLTDALVRPLGQGSVFRDVAGITPGDDFEQALEEGLRRTRVALVLLGPAWLAELQRRLALPERDFVRIEVARVLKSGHRVVPVLLRGATLPPAEDLPGDMKALSRRQAMTLRDEAWDADVKRLVAVIGTPYSWWALAARAAVFLLAALVLVRWSMADAAMEEVRLVLGVALGGYALAESGAAAWRRWGRTV
jgi:hypothetical protein